MKILLTIILASLVIIVLMFILNYASFDGIKDDNKIKNFQDKDLNEQRKNKRENH